VKSVLCRRTYFQCVHKYVSPLLSEKENLSEFGACYTPHGHGHNYTLDAYVEGQVDSVTGMVINLRDLDLALREAVQILDHKHLNFEVAAFKECIPTTENIAAFLYSSLKKTLQNYPVTLNRIRLYESEDLWVDYFE
jgi:6-pyruvoyltetrahydropterin/6-carboxytetrahydropterin synthase